MTHRIGSKAWIAARNKKIAKAMRKRWANKKHGPKKVTTSRGRALSKSLMHFPAKVNGRKATISIPVTITFE